MCLAMAWAWGARPCLKELTVTGPTWLRRRSPLVSRLQLSAQLGSQEAVFIVLVLLGHSPASGSWQSFTCALKLGAGVQKLNREQREKGTKSRSQLKLPSLVPVDASWLSLYTPSPAHYRGLPSGSASEPKR